MHTEACRAKTDLMLEIHFQMLEKNKEIKKMNGQSKCGKILIDVKYKWWYMEGLFYYSLLLSIFGIFENINNNKIQVIASTHTYTNTKLVSSVHLPRTICQ